MSIARVGLDHVYKWLSISVALVVLDQWSKQIVVNAMMLGEQIQVFSYFSWVRWHNEGAAFSFLSDAGGWQRWFFILLAIGFVSFLTIELWRLGKKNSILHLIYALIIGGALGNMIDRLIQGYVVDFILLHYDRYYFPAFNIADAALSVGAICWGLLLVKEALNERKMKLKERSD